MAKSVDEKIVQLTLDNKQFNKATDETIDSLEELKKSLEFEGAIDAFDEVEKSVKKVDFNPLNKGIETVSNNFNALNTIADAALRNITNSIINSSERMLKSLSIDQITTGWDKYAEKTGAVQTIMAATAQQFDDTGEQMEVVNEQLSRLTWFTDETSHKFNDMVNGIGKFTSNNIDLETSVKAMEGIATWASLSGSNANEASRAIYNLAQAVSVGSVKLIDWNSIANANMGTTEFRRTVIETAEAMGTLVKVSDDLWSTLDGKGTVSVANFTNELSRGWFTSEVLLKSLDKYGNFADTLGRFADETGVLTATLMNWVDEYADGTLNMEEAMRLTQMSAEELTEWLDDLASDENELGRRAFRASQETKTFAEAIDYVKEAVSSGWATSFEHIFGDYEEAKKWWSEIAEVMYDAFVVGGELRNEVLEMWKDGGGREDFLNGIREIIQNVMDIVNIFKNSWNAVWFGDDETNQVKNMADALARVTKGFLEFAKAIKPTETTTENLNRLFKSIFSILKTGVNVIRAIGKGLEPIANLLNIILGTALQFAANVAEGLANGLNNFFNPSTLNTIANALQLIASVLSGVIQIGLATVLSLLKNLMNTLGSIFSQIKESGGGIRGVITVLVDTVRDFFNAFMEGETIVNKVANAILFIFGGLAAGIGAIIDTIFKLITGELTFGDLFSGNGAVSDVIGGFDKVLTDLNIQDKVANIISWVKDFCEELVAADGIIVQFVNNISDAIRFFWGVLKGILEEISIDDIKDILLIAVLWQFISSITAVNKSMSGAINGFSGLVGTFNNVIKELTETGAPKLDILAKIMQKSQILQIGIAVTMLVAALGKLNTLDYKKTQQSVAALGVTLAILLAAMKVLSKILATMPKKEKSNEMEKVFNDLSKNLMLIGASALMVAQAMKVISDTFFSEAGDFDWKRYALIAGGVTILIAALAGVTKIMGTIDNKGIGNLVSLIALGASLRLVAESIKALDAFEDSGKLIAACLGIGAVILALGESVKLMHKTDWKTALATVPVIISFALALGIMSASIAGLSLLSNYGDIQAGIDALAMTTLALTVGISVLGNALKKTPPAVILATSTALIAMSSAILIIAGAMKIVENIDIAKSGGAFITLALGFAELAAALGALGVVLQTVSPKLISSIGWAMIEMAGAVAILAGSLLMINGLDWESIKTGVLTIGALLAVFTALGGVVAFFDMQTFGLVSEAIINLSDAFLKFSAAIGILSAAILALSVASGVMATIVAAFQALAEKVGVDFPTMVQQGFDGLELIIREFLEMVRNLAPDMLATFIMLFGMIALAIETVKHPTAAAMVGIIMALADEIANHGQDFVDALIKIVEFINSASDLFQALEDLCFTIGEFIGAGLINVLKGLVEGIVGEIMEMLGIEFDVQSMGLGKDMNKSFNNALEQISDEKSTELAKMQAFQVINNIVDAWTKGEADLSDEAVNMALVSMGEFRETTKGETRKSVDDMLEQLAIGITENKTNFKDTSGLIGEYVKEGVGESLDPDKPFDWFRKIFGDEIAVMMAAGVEDILPYVQELGESIGLSLADGAFDGASSLADLPKLVFGKKNVEQPEMTGIQKKMAELMKEDFEEPVKKSVDETNKEVGKSGYGAGEDWVNNLSKGIGSSGSKSKASSAAKETANTIADAFSEELDQISRDTQISDKLFQLWKAQNPDASEMELTAKQIEYQSEKVALATQKASISQQIYQQTLEEMGESAKETHEAYISMLDDQIAMLEARNELDKLQSDGAQSGVDAFRAFSKELGSMYKKNEDGSRTMAEFLQSLGASQEQIMKIAADNAGYKLPQMVEEAGNAAVEKSGEMAEEIMNNFGDAIDTVGEDAINKLSETADTIVNESGSLLNGAVLKSITLDQNGIYTVLDNNGELIKNVSEVMTDDVANIATVINDNSDSAFKEACINAVTMTEEDITTVTESVDTSINTIKDATIESINEAADTLSTEGEPIFTDAYTNMMTVNSEEISPVVTEGLTNTMDLGIEGYLAQDNSESVDPIGVGMTNEIAESMTNNAETVTEAFKETMDAPLTYFDTQGYLDWQEVGVKVDDSQITGIKQEAPAVNTAIRQLGQDMYDEFCDFLGISGGYSQLFYSVGQMIDDGVANGIAEGKSKVINAAVEMATAAYQAACAALQIASPSKKMYEVGRYFDLGLKSGIDNYSVQVERSVREMTERMVDSVNDNAATDFATKSLSDMFDINEDDLHMTVVMDLDSKAVDAKMSQLERAYAVGGSLGQYNAANTSAYDVSQSGKLDAMVNQISNSVQYQAELLGTLFGHIERTMSEPVDTGITFKEAEAAAPSVNFTQNNYSPKEISRVETYRNTKRQIDTFSRKFSLTTR